MKKHLLWLIPLVGAAAVAFGNAVYSVLEVLIR